jgi:hypothetical protein
MITQPTATTPRSVDYAVVVQGDTAFYEATVLLPGVIANYLKCLAQTHSAVSRAVRDAGLVREVELVVPWGARGEAINEFSTRAVINRLREEEEGEHRTQTNAGEATLRWGPRRTVLSSQRDGLRCEVPEREGVVVHSLMEFASTPAWLS